MTDQDLNDPANRKIGWYRVRVDGDNQVKEVLAHVPLGIPMPSTLNQGEQYLYWQDGQWHSHEPL